MATFSIPLFDVNFDNTEVQAVADTVRSRWISMGSKVLQLEKLACERTGCKHAVAVNSCTAALHLALLAAGVGPGCEVILPSLTFVATANAVRYVGATPIFCDIISTREPNLDPAHVVALITPQTKAIIPMHYGGFPCRMNELMAIAERHRVTVIHDAAHAIATTYEGRHVADTGDIACFSLFANKVITSAEGGFVTTNNDEYAKTIRLMRSHGMTTLSYDRARGHASEYDVVQLGYNYRLDDIRGALAVAQFAKLDSIIEARNKLRKIYLEKLSIIPEVIVPFSQFICGSSHYIMPICLRCASDASDTSDSASFANAPRTLAVRRNQVRQIMAELGVQTSVHYPPAHEFRIYHDETHPVSLPQTQVYADTTITLPLFDSLTSAQIDEVVSALRTAIARS